MPHQKGTGKSRLIILALLTASIMLSIPLGLLTHTLVSGALDINTSNHFGLFILFMLLSVTISTLILSFSTTAIDKIAKEHAHTGELRNFKHYIDTLHNAVSEDEILEVLFDHTRSIPSNGHTSIYYQTDSGSETSTWQKITDEDFPLCSMTPLRCPVLRTNRDFLKEDIQSRQNCPCLQEVYKQGSYVCIPTSDSGSPQGILQLYSKNRNFFNARVMYKVKAYIEISKLVINKNRTLYALHRKAITDKLTGLYNRGFLDAYLKTQVEAASLSGQNLSIIIADLDHFKKVNDTYGHQAGDHVLVFFSGLLQSCVRKSDAAVRYGGDEFLIILPSTDTATAEVIAERIRCTAASSMVPRLNDMDLPAINCSLGISTYSMHCSSPENLVKAADSALYKAKQAGRNCTMTSEMELNQYLCL